MNIRQFMAAIAVAKKMNIDEPCFEYDIDFDDVIGVMMLPRLGDKSTKAIVFLGEFSAKATLLNLKEIYVDADEVQKVADRIGYLDFF